MDERVQHGARGRGERRGGSTYAWQWISRLILRRSRHLQAKLLWSSFLGMEIVRKG